MKCGKVIAEPKELIRIVKEVNTMGDEKEEGRRVLKEMRMCHCNIHDIDYPCADGCPRCK